LLCVIQKKEGLERKLTRLFQQAEHEQSRCGSRPWLAPDGHASVAFTGGSQVSAIRNQKPVHVGLIADEPIRLEGLISIFEAQTDDSQTRLLPVPGTLEELLANRPLEYLVFDLNSSSGGLETLDLIRRARPDLRLIVLGPEGQDELILSTIIAGARAYLDLTAGPETVGMAIKAVTSGSIWAPRRLLSKLIDRLLSARDSRLLNGTSHLTARERQVLELILAARSNREIARQLGIEERTVKAHVGRLMRKAGVENRIELSMRALSRPLGTDSGGHAKRKHGHARAH
jgi:DNA-binding NarL/FixJ family response regulator